MLRSIKRIALLSVAIGSFSVFASAATRDQLYSAHLGLGPQLHARVAAEAKAERRAPRSGRPIGSMSPAERRAAVDAYWGEGPSTAEKLQIFDKFWQYADAKFAGFQNLEVDWGALRALYRPEVAAGVSRGRFAAILNHLALALRDSHTIPLDLLVNVDTVPEPGVPLMGLSGWQFDTSGACLTAQDDGSALVYAAIFNHPLGLEPGDRILGYDGRPWRELYQQLVQEELPLWPLWWGSTPSSFEHTFVMSAGLNWHLFETMDIAKHDTGNVVHMPTSLMPGSLFFGFCSEQMKIAGVPKPTFFDGTFVTSGIVDGTRIGYIYSWSWDGDAVDQFSSAVHELTQVQRVDGLIIDFRFNEGGFISAPFSGLSVLSSHPTATLGMDERLKPSDHFRMKNLANPSGFKLDFDSEGSRVKASYTGPIAVLVGPGAVSAGDFSALWATYLPRVRTFGKSTSMAVGFPTQEALGTSLDLGFDWFARVAETNAYAVGAPKDYLIHTEFPVGEPVWLQPDDVAAGKDTVVNAALDWLHQEIGH